MVFINYQVRYISVFVKLTNNFHPKNNFQLHSENEGHIVATCCIKAFSGII